MISRKIHLKFQIHYSCKINNENLSPISDNIQQKSSFNAKRSHFYFSPILYLLIALFERVEIKRKSVLELKNTNIFVILSKIDKTF